MDRDRFTFLFIADPAKPARTVHLPRRLVRLAVGGIAGLMLFLLVSSTGLVLWVGNHAKATRLERENEQMAFDLVRMQQKVAQLSESINAMSERDRRFRLLAGLPDIDSEVRQVGIGGPGTGSIQDDPLFQLNPDIGEQVFATSRDANRLLRQANLLQVSMEQTAREMESHQENLAGYPSIYPVKGWLSSTFQSKRWHPVLNVRRPHEGIDLSAWPGTPVLATADGRVTFAGWRPGYGHTVEIDHGNGLKTRYAHNQKRLKVRKGDPVRRGDVIAHVGSSGLSKGPHVHYEVRKNGRAVNPDDYRLDKVIVE